jgi:hypothetical protein
MTYGSPTLVLVPVLNISKVINSGIVVVLSREDDSVQVTRMSVGNRMAY